MNKRLSTRVLSFCLLGLLLLVPLWVCAQRSDEWAYIGMAIRGGGLPIYADQSLLLTANAGGIYRSVDSGTTWEAGGAIPETGVRSFIASDGHLFAATNKGVYRSADGGRSWQAVNNGLLMPASGGGMAVPIIRSLVARENVLYAAAVATEASTMEITGSIFVSTDQGNMWLERQTGLSFGAAATLAAGEDRIFFLNARGRIYSLSDNGQTLSEIASVNFADTVGRATKLAAVGQTLIATGTRMEDNLVGVYRSNDGGRTWANANAGILRSQLMCPTLAIEYLNASQGLLLAAVSTGDCAFPKELAVYVSFDQAGSWVSFNSPTAASRHSHLDALAANDKYIFTVGGALSDYLLYRRSYAPPPAPYLASVSAASYRQDDVGRISIIAAFGANLAAATEAATVVPLPTTLAGVSVLVKDSQGNERAAPLFFVSPTQINYQVPEEAAVGEAEVVVRHGDSVVAVGRTIIRWRAPSLFTADASGKGVPAALVLRIKADGAQTFEPVAQFDPALNKFVPVPIDLCAESEQVYLILFGTGIRGLSLRDMRINTPALSNETEPIAITYADAAPGFVGLDQVNALLSRSLAGKGEIELQLSHLSSYYSNRVRISVK